MEASIRRMESHFEIIAEAMQSMVHEESSSNSEKENAPTIPSNGENVKTEVSFDFFDYLPSVSGKEIEKEETEEQMKEADDVSFEHHSYTRSPCLMSLLLLIHAAYTKAIGI